MSRAVRDLLRLGGRPALRWLLAGRPSTGPLADAMLDWLLEPLPEPVTLADVAAEYEDDRG